MTAVQKRVLVGVGVVLAIVLVGYVLLALSSGSSAPTGTTVGGVDISGMTQEQAAQAVADELDPVAQKKMKVKVLDSTFRIAPAEAGLTLDAAASVAPAYERTWNPLTLVSNLTGSTTLPARVSVDETLLSAQVDVMAGAIDNPPVEPVLEVKDGVATVTPGTPGRAIDREATKSALTLALLEPRAPVVAVVATVEPTVTQEATQQAVAQAEEAVSSPVTVTAGTVTASIPPAAIGHALSFTAQDGALVPTLDGAVLHKAIAKELRPIEVKGRDATFKIRNGKPKVVKSKVGQGVSDDELAAAVTDVLALPATERSVTVPVGTREPKLTTEEAKALGVTERMSSFTQYFPYAAYRVQNIGQAAKRINGTILMPGETFSLNDTIKERTEKNGYTEGFVVGEGGVFAEALGGGVSTSATATWTAAFYAGMERVQTVAHSIYISRYKPGLEATVAWGLFDMKFRNDTPNAVFITSGITNGSINVSFWGTKQYDDIQAEYGERTGIVPFTTIYDESDTCLGQAGVDGFTITVDRVFYKDGAEVKREPITTRYKPAPEVICGKEPDKKGGKGNKPKGQDATAGSEPSPSATPKGDKPAGKPSDPPSDQPSDQPTGDDVFTNG
jgi:vancomycin resistance protein YoaR